ncbi:hypothetical protein HA466_0013680 [Hirschfeldia incana]|nr:hypothetical protein HA466_0013680 [Hirschfeldia incana]
MVAAAHPGDVDVAAAAHNAGVATEQDEITRLFVPHHHHHLHKPKASIFKTQICRDAFVSQADTQIHFLFLSSFPVKIPK